MNSQLRWYGVVPKGEGRKWGCDHVKAYSAKDAVDKSGGPSKAYVDKYWTVRARKFHRRHGD